MTRGFVTVATGSERYYELAANLCLSYKKRGNGKYPFAIICDRKNKYTEIFDDVILIDQYRKSTVDKLLMVNSQYDESIFMDTDMLVLENVDDLWDVFKDADDVSVFGITLPLDSKEGWFTYNGSGPYKEKIDYLISMNGGIYYFRNTERAKKIFADAIKAIADYQKIDFKYFDQPQDEPLMALSMVINHCKPCESGYEMMILPVCKQPITVDAGGNVYDGRKRSAAKVIHFSTPRTVMFLYNYLNEINYQEEQWKNRKNYNKLKRQYARNDFRFNAFHNAGAILRRVGLDGLVERIKKKLR